MTTHRIAVLMNCQAPLWADSLQALVSDVDIACAFHVGVTVDLAGSVAAASAAGCDTLIVVNELVTEVADECARVGYAPETVVAVPGLYFAGFHPDLGYGFDGDERVRSPWGTDWVPRIAIGAYSLGLTLEQTLAMYSTPCFDALGYLDRWNPSSEALRVRFDETGFDFTQWMRATKRTGVFMHGLNHPRPLAVAALAEQVCRDRLGLKPRPAHTVEGVLYDALATSVIWPVHEPVAARLGVPAVEVVKINGRFIPWTEFVVGCYTDWSERGVSTDASVLPSLSQHELNTLVSFAGAMSL
ncbi:MAG: WcbI family polysaccharide biosynthesis putative acetyltransferase [Actinomycetes bacterium]